MTEPSTKVREHYSSTGLTDRVKRRSQRCKAVEPAREK
jgi:hypothetical protein